jgi:LysR family glycine cleavage system transcriptional activator
VTIGATTSVSSLWLTPRLAGFWSDHKTIAVSQLVEDRKFLRPFRPDLIIEYATEPPKDAADLLFGDALVPLCAPGYPRSGAPDLAQIAQERLIHLDAADRNWTTWRSWFSDLGYDGPIRTGQTVNNYSIALQLAQEGNGVVLGWRALVAPLIDRGLLQPFCDLSSPAPGAFYLVQGQGDLSAPAGQFRDWLLASIRKG